VGGENGLLQSSLFNGYGINAEGSFRMGIGIGEMRDHPDYVTGVLKNFSRNRGRRGHHFFEESPVFLVRCANANAGKGSVFERRHDFRRRRRGYPKGTGDMGRCFCSETEA
jgi:hypothetical protein